MGGIPGISRPRLLLVAGAGLATVAVAVIVAVVLSGSGGSATTAGDTRPSPTATASATATPTATASPTPADPPHAGILDGAPMTAEEWAARRDLLPLAVMFDNTPNAIPHHGIGEADLVYEALVEGGITRLMAVFWRRDPGLIMPVRSARTPFVIWVDELGALYSHAGSATTTNEANAAGQIIEWGIRDLDAFKPGSNVAYYRDASRYAPYNLATTAERLRATAIALGYAGPPSVEPWRFRNPSDPQQGVPAGGIQVDFSGRMYGWQLIQWKWDEARKAYGRFQFGGPYVDGNTGQQLFFSTVIVMRVNAAVVDSSGHVLLEQFGEGPATVFTGGRAIEGTWRKADRKARTRFYDASGKEIAFERGPVFIEVIPQQGTFVFTANPGDLPDLPKYIPPPPPAPGEDEEPTPGPAPEPTATPTPPPATSSPTQAPPAPSVTPTPPATAETTASPSSNPSPGP